MALSPSSILHYWSARNESMPYVGGKPVHSRNSTARWIDARGFLQDAPVNTPRFEWASIAGETRKVMRLEQARTNEMTQSEDFNQWTFSNLTQTTGQKDPVGGTAATLLNATVGSGNASRTLTYTADGEKVVSVFLKAGTGAVTRVEALDNTVPASRHMIGVTWAAGVPTLSTLNGSGTRYPPLAMGGGWWWIAFSAPSIVAANANYVVISPAGTGTGTVYAFGVQGEDARTPSSYNKAVASTVTRSADSFYWDFTPAPQAMMAYCRFVERGTFAGAGAILSIVNASPSGAAFMIYKEASGNYRTYHNTSGGAVTAQLGTLPAYGDVCELVGVLTASGQVECYQSINGAAATAAGLSSANALESAWAAPRLWGNNYGAHASYYGLTDLAEIKLVKYADVVASTAQGIMDELRAFEINSAGEVL